MIDPLSAGYKPEDILAALEKYDCEQSLSHFIKSFWFAVEPATPLVWGWPLDAMCHHLEAVSRGEIKRLLINVPPGFMKSLLVCVFWPAWEWGCLNRAHYRYIAAAYTQSLTVRDNVRFRRLVSCDLYQKYWGDRVQLTTSAVEQVANMQTGSKIATSVSGMGTGARGNRFIIDDGNSVAEAESKAVMESTNTWVKEVVPDRLNNMQEDVIINIQQRTGENDISGTLLGLDVGYVHLCIPMEYDPDRNTDTIIGWSDPRAVEGELAWPERFTQESCDNLKAIKGSYAWAGQYQQSPQPRGGGIIKRDYWQMWPPEGKEEEWTRDGSLVFPEMEYILASADTAYTEKESNDYSALTILGLWRDKLGNPKIMVMRAWKERLQLNDCVKRIQATCRRYSVDRLLIEAKASGISAAQELRRLYGSEAWGTELIVPKGDKFSRVSAIQGMFEEGMIYAPDTVWAESLINSFSVFPKGAHDDDVDSATQGISFLRRIGLLLRSDEHTARIEEEFSPHGDVRNDGLGYDV